MFDIGFSELFLIGIVALVVLGPERLPKAARFVGLWVRRARAQWYSVKSELEHELADDELRRSLRATRDELRAAHEDLRTHGASMRAQLASVGDDARELDAQLRDEVNAAVRGTPVMTGPLATPASMDVTEHALDPHAAPVGSVVSVEHGPTTPSAATGVPPAPFGGMDVSAPDRTRVDDVDAGR